MGKRLALLDRDGVLNKLVVDAEQGTIDSPLHPSQVVVYPEAVVAVKRLGELGYTLAICTNQPSAAKGKTTLANLEAVHAKIVAELEAGGGRIASSHICFHRSEDKCACRKPATGLLEAAFAANPACARAGSWMIGDGMTDVQAGHALGLKTAFVGLRKVEYLKVFGEYKIEPDAWCASISEFVDVVSEMEKTR